MWEHSFRLLSHIISFAETHANRLICVWCFREKLWKRQLWYDGGCHASLTCSPATESRPILLTVTSTGIQQDWLTQIESISQYALLYVSQPTLIVHHQSFSYIFIFCSDCIWDSSRFLQGNTWPVSSNVTPVLSFEQTFLALSRRVSQVSCVFVKRRMFKLHLV